MIWALAQKFPNARFEYLYEENGVGFCGKEIYENGKLQYQLEADLEKYYLEDDEEIDLRFSDYQEGRDEETIVESTIMLGELRIGKIIKREDRDNCVRLISGYF